MKKIKSMKNQTHIWYNKQNDVETWTVEYKADFENFDTFEAAIERANELSGITEAIDVAYDTEENKIMLKPRLSQVPFNKPTLDDGDSNFE